MPPASPPCRVPRLLCRLLLLGAGLAMAGNAVAQDSAVPDAGYFATMEDLYRGEYRQAERGFRNEVRGGIRTVQARWVDSICYRTMLGETYYQMGAPARALAEFDAACELFLSYPRWLLTVEFRQPLRPDTNTARLIAPWGRTTRQTTYGAFSDTMLVRQGEMLTEQRVRQGGALQAPIMLRINVVEVLRTTALAIRRRNEILGPLAQHDSVSKSLVDSLARGGNTVRGHWSNAWTEVLLGYAQMGVGESQQALTHFSRGILVDGRYDHPLTGAALLGQAQLALQAGNAQAAANLATEASYAAYAFEDYDVVGAALELGNTAFLASQAEGTYPPLATAAEWARRQNYDHLAAEFRIGQAEALAAGGASRQASSALGGISARRRDLAAGRLGPLRTYVEAFIAYGSGNSDLGDRRASATLAQHRPQSLRHTQVVLANQRVDGGQISPRIAVDLYAELLRDPAPTDWALAPLETLTNLTTSYEGALGRWLVASLSREEILPAMDITEIAKRRRFYRAQPLGGRLLVLRHLLESPTEKLSDAAKLQRRNLLLKAPAYAELSQQAEALSRDLAAKPLVTAEGGLARDQQATLKQLAKNANQREEMLRTLVMRRDATDYDLPPRLTAAEAQGNLKPGQVLMVFHQSGSTMLAFIMTRDSYHTWRLPDLGPLSEQTAEMLREMGHYSQSRTFTSEDLSVERWQDIAKRYGDILLGQSRLDLSKTTELVIVPDGVLWHVPFEALQPSTGGNKQYIIDRTPLRLAPTIGFAAGVPDTPRLIRTTGIAASSDDDYQSEQLIAELKDVVEGPLVLESPLPAPSTLLASQLEQLVVQAEAELDSDEPYSFVPLPLDRSSAVGSLSGWLQLPLPDCDRLVLSGVRTLAETGLKARGRGRSKESTAPLGRELFHVSCSLLAGGADTVLLSRWQTSGKTHRDLVREFVLELPHVAADQAWRRSVALARRTDLDPLQEPRLKRTSGEVVATAEHPFLWSGYLLLDTGYDPVPAFPADGEQPAQGEEPAQFQ